MCQGPPAYRAAVGQREERGTHHVQALTQRFFCARCDRAGWWTSQARPSPRTSCRNGGRAHPHTHAHRPHTEPASRRSEELVDLTESGESGAHSAKYIMCILQ